jgi:formate hydrogenlyase subunit 6/NADH:ubiquinone oxidoreductase subunit I
MPLKFLKQVSDYAKETVQAARYIGQGLSVTFDHMRRRPITVQYPYEKLIPSERFGVGFTLNLISAFLVKFVSEFARLTYP